MTVDLDTVVLERGAHKAREDRVCALEAVAWLAGDPHTDALVGLVEKIVDTHYPAGTFTGASGDRGARFVAALHRALADLDPEDP